MVDDTLDTGSRDADIAWTVAALAHHDPIVVRRTPRGAAASERMRAAFQGICLPLNSYEASNLPVERARRTVGADAQVGGRAAHRHVRRTGGKNAGATA
jgi:hypothetical protein